MDYLDIQPALVQWVKLLTGLAVVVWENEPRPYAPGALALLSWVAEDDRGDTDVRYELDENGDLVEVRVNFRTLTLQIAVETIGQNAASPHARAVLSRVRARVPRSDAREVLHAANVSIIGFDSTTQADYRFEQRMISRAVMTVRLNATTYDRDTDAPVGTIERVDLTSHTQRTDGTELGAVEQMISEEISE